MTRSALPYSAPDLSALARHLVRAIADLQSTQGRLPGHVEMMNLLARGAGRRNLQALRAEAASDAVAAQATTAASAPAAETAADPWFDAPEILAAPPAPTAPVELTTRARKALQQFDATGRLAHWPLKRSVQRLVLWVLWTRFDGRRVYTEPEVNRVLKAWHTYGDHATLRRELIDHGLMSREDDCSAYRKLAVRPDAEALAVLHALRDGMRRRTGRRTSTPRGTPRAAGVDTGTDTGAGGRPLAGAAAAVAGTAGSVAAAARPATGAAGSSATPGRGAEAVS